MKPSAVAALATLVGVGLCLPSAESRYHLRTVHQFPNYTWIENMAVRANGQILGTDLASSRIYLVNPANPQSTAVVHQFADRTCLTGITELEPDVFITQSLTCDIYQFNFVPNTTTIYKVDMRLYDLTKTAKVTRIGTIPQARVPNGNCVLSPKDGTILVADSVLGAIFRFNTRTGASNVAFSGDSTLTSISSMTPAFGINGIHLLNGILYYTNVNKGLFAKVPISSSGTPTAKPTVITSNVPTADDFTIDTQGNAWITQNDLNTLVRVSPNGQVQQIVGGPNSTALAGPVRAVFGRGVLDRHTLYISTDGLIFDANGQPTSTAGKIAAIDTNSSGTLSDP